MGYIGTKPAAAPLTTSQLEDGLVTAAKIATDAVETAKVKDVNVTAGKLAATQDLSTKTITLPATVAGLGTGLTNAQLQNNSITIDGSTVALGGTATIVTSPTITSLTPSVVPNTSTAVVIAGTNFSNMPAVEAINATGAIVVADSISYTSAASITATFTLPVDGTYFVRVENPDGVAVRTATAALTVSDVPAWVTGSGSLGSFGGGSSIGTINLEATDSTGMTLQSGSLPGGISLNTAVTTSTLTGTESGASADTTYSFTIRATDAEAQTADRAFTLTFTFNAENSCQFN